MKMGVTNGYTLNKYIRDLRERKDMTQLEVAEKMGLCRSAYSQIENGKISALPHLDELLSALGNDVADFFPYDIHKYTNNKLLIYMLLYGVDYSIVGKALKMNTSRLKKLLLSDKKKYLIKYKEEIEMLFPDLDSNITSSDYERIGANSIVMRIDGKDYIFLNVLGEKDTDKILDFAQATNI